MEGQSSSESKYQEIEKLIPELVQQIKKILEEEHNLTVPDQCDEFVARCLRLKDGNVEKAIKLIQEFYAATEDFKDWDATLLPSVHSDFYKSEVVTPLLKRDDQGRRIVIIRAALWNPKVTSFEEALASIWMLAQFLNANHVDSQRDGYVTIWDFKNFSLQQAWAVNHMKLLTVAKWVQNGVAGRIKAFHAVNHSRVVSVIYSAIKPFLKEKLKRRIHFHDKEEDVLKHVPVNSLPTYLGGSENPELCIDMAFLNAVLQEDEYFQDMMNHRLPIK